MIELKGITKVYQMGDEPLNILKGVDLSVKEGEFVAIMGPSGSGKSTLMHILGLLDRPTNGSWTVSGPLRQPWWSSGTLTGSTGSRGS